jgi:sugar phosphate permease
MIAFIPLFLVDRFGLSKEAAAVFLSIFYSAGLWASLLGGVLSDRIGSVPVVWTVCLITGPAIYLLNFMPAAVGVGAILFVLGICNYIRTPVSETYLVGHTSEKNRSTVLGIYYFSNIEGGGVLTPVMGFLIDRYGFYTSFSVAGTTVAVLSLICWAWLRGVRKKWTRVLAILKRSIKRFMRLRMSTRSTGWNCASAWLRSWDCRRMR